MERGFFDVCERTFAFALSTIRLCNDIGYTTASGIVTKQLIRSATSVGANVEEAQSAISKADFIRKMFIALGEAREAHYWLRLLIATGLADSRSAASLLEECNQLKRILGAIVSSARGTRRMTHL